VRSPALQIKLQGVDIKEATGLSLHASTYGKVKKVLAGWSHSSAYIYGYGIVIWNSVERDNDDDDDDEDAEQATTDTMLVFEHVEVPKTRYQRVKDTHGESDDKRVLGEEVGAVLNYIMLEHFVLFITDIGKVFCAKIRENNRVDDILELRSLRNDNHNNSTLDVQGSFRRFAVFRGDEVITSDQDYLEACWSAKRNNLEQSGIPGLHKIPALQHNDVISVAFGDYHYLALHSNGKITSYGKELNACGALGLGGEDEGRARGIVYNRFTHDGSLLPHASTRGRQVWFDRKKVDWLRHITQGGKDPEESTERIELFRTESNVQGEVSEWIEQEGRSWDHTNTGEDGLGAYFALGISAAGWHSGALTLVNEELANRTPEYKWEDQSFPRLKLADGTEMPGSKDFDEWREGRPEWQFDAEV
jgi:SCF-associated factor 1